MENFRSWRDSWKAARRSARIDSEIKGDAKELKKTRKILLLGLSESGKSTIVKQIRITHQGGFSQDARMKYREAVYSNLLESAQAMATALQQFRVTPADPSNVQTLELLLEYDLEAELQSPTCPFLFSFPSQLIKAIHGLWQDQAVSEFTNSHGPQLCLMDNATYFFNEARRIASTDYIPTETDILLCRQRSTGIVETNFDLPPYPIHLVEMGGPQGERKKWIHCFESVTVLIYCAALSDYDRTLTEDRNRNRMAESLVLFDAIVNSRWFLRTSIVLFLNKIDVFRRKLPKVPLELYFQEYTGGPKVDKASKYILWRFMQANRAKLTVFPHIMQATDRLPTNLISAVVIQTKHRNRLKDLGLL